MTGPRRWGWQHEDAGWYYYDGSDRPATRVRDETITGDPDRARDMLVRRGLPLPPPLAAVTLDPDDTVARMRNFLTFGTFGVRTVAGYAELARRFRALDLYLRDGGKPPRDWSPWADALADAHRTAIEHLEADHDALRRVWAYAAQLEQTASVPSFVARNLRAAVTGDEGPPPGGGSPLDAIRRLVPRGYQLDDAYTSDAETVGRIHLLLWGEEPGGVITDSVGEPVPDVRRPARLCGNCGEEIDADDDGCPDEGEFSGEPGDD